MTSVPRPHDAQPLVEVARPRQDLRRLAALAEPRRRAQAAAVRARGRRRRASRSQRGQTLALVGESGCGKSTVARLLVGPVRADARQRRLRRQSTRTRRCAQPPARDAAPAHADDLPGPVREPESALEGARHRRRAAARARPRSTTASARAATRARRRAAAVGRPRRRRHGEVPAPVLGRPAPAHLDRARAGDAARVPGLRRADVGARRVGAGAGPQHHEGPAARSRA